MGEAALEESDLIMARKAFVEAHDYPSMEFIKRLELVQVVIFPPCEIFLLQDKGKQKAEVSAFLGRIDVAEQLYLDMDRRDLAIECHVLVGNWERVVQLMEQTNTSFGYSSTSPSSDPQFIASTSCQLGAP